MVAHELVNGGRSPEVLARNALRGDLDAREELVRAIRDQVYGLALRMLAEPADAEDATQEILIKVITRLDSFRGESRFTTWVHALAANHLRTIHARRRQRWWSSFDQIVEIQESLLPVVAPVAERAVLTRELEVLCLHGLRICLDRDHRLALVLGELLELSSVEAAQVLGIRPATFRKRLSRARRRMRDFMLYHGEPARPERSWGPRRRGRSSPSARTDRIPTFNASCRVRLDEVQRVKGACHGR